MCFIIWNATSVLLFILFPCKSVIEKTTVLLFILFPCKSVTEKITIVFFTKPIYSRKQALCFSTSRVRRDSNKFKYSSKWKGDANLFAFLIFVNARIINRKEKKNPSQIIIDCVSLNNLCCIKYSTFIFWFVNFYMCSSWFVNLGSANCYIPQLFN